MATRYVPLGPMFSGEGSRAFLGLRILDDEPSPCALVWAPEDVLATPELAERLRKETATAVTLSHPNVLRVFGLAELDEGLARAVEFNDGESLRRIIDNAKQLSVDVAARIVLDVAAGVHYAHLTGREDGTPRVHGDLRPETVFVSFSGIAKVSGYGALTVAPREVGGRRVPGRRQHAAPEQILGGRHAATPQTDVYLLGLLLLEMITGRIAFEGEKDFDWAVVIQQRPVILESELVPLRLRAVIAKAMAKKAQLRFQSVKDFRDAVEEAVGTVPEHSAVAQFLERTFADQNARGARLEELERAMREWTHQHNATAAPPPSLDAPPAAPELSPPTVKVEPPPAPPQIAPAPAATSSAPVPAPPSDATHPEATLPPTHAAAVHDDALPVAPGDAPCDAADGAGSEEHAGAPTPAAALPPPPAPPAATVPMARIRPQRRAVPMPEPAWAASAAPPVEAEHEGSASRLAQRTSPEPHSLSQQWPAGKALLEPAASRPRRKRRRAGFSPWVWVAPIVLGAAGAAFWFGQHATDARALLVDPLVQRTQLANAAAAPTPKAAVPANMNLAEVVAAQMSDASRAHKPPAAREPAAAPPTPKSTLTVETQPPVNVSIDGRPAGRAPVEAKLSVGAHRVTLSDPAQGIRVTRTVHAKPGANRLSVDLGKGTLAVTAPDGCEVRIDGRVMGRTPLDSAIPLYEGSHHLQVRQGQAKWEQNFSISDRQQMTAEVRFEPAG